MTSSRRVFISHVVECLFLLLQRQQFEEERARHLTEEFFNLTPFREAKKQQQVNGSSAHPPPPLPVALEAPAPSSSGHSSEKTVTSQVTSSSSQSEAETSSRRVNGSAAAAAAVQLSNGSAQDAHAPETTTAAGGASQSSAPVATNGSERRPRCKCSLLHLLVHVLFAPAFPSHRSSLVCLHSSQLTAFRELTQTP